MNDIVKQIRKRVSELRRVKFPWRPEYGYGYRDALDQVQKAIAQEVRKHNRKYGIVTYKPPKKKERGELCQEEAE